MTSENFVFQRCSCWWQVTDITLEIWIKIPPKLGMGLIVAEHLLSPQAVITHLSSLSIVSRVGMSASCPENWSYGKLTRISTLEFRAIVRQARGRCFESLPIRWLCVASGRFETPVATILTIKRRFQRLNYKSTFQLMPFLSFLNHPVCPHLLFEIFSTKIVLTSLRSSPSGRSQ